MKKLFIVLIMGIVVLGLTGCTESTYDGNTVKEVETLPEDAFRIDVLDQYSYSLGVITARVALVNGNYNYTVNVDGELGAFASDRLFSIDEEVLLAEYDGLLIVVDLS